MTGRSFQALRRIGDALLVLGLVVGTGAIVGYQLDIIPNLPPAVLKLVLYKLTLVGGLGLLVAGAFVRRAANRERERDESLANSPYRSEKNLDALEPPRRGDDLEMNAPRREKQKAPSVKKPRSPDVL